MRRIATLVGRELRSYFLAPSGYIIIAIYLLLASIVFVSQAFETGQPATMRRVFELSTWMLLFLCPAISMRAIAEERRHGTYELLMTSPVSEGQVVLAKFLGGLIFLAIMLGATFAHVGLLEWFGRPDYGELGAGYLGMMLLGAAYLATGLLASTLTNSQIVAFIMALFFWVGLSLGAKLLPMRLPEPWATMTFAIDPEPRVRDFIIGLIDSSNVVYFVSITAVFLIAARRSLAAGRWG